MSIDKQKTHKLLTEIDQLTIPIPDIFAIELDEGCPRCGRYQADIRHLCTACQNAEKNYNLKVQSDSAECPICEGTLLKNWSGVIYYWIPSTDGWEWEAWAHRNCIVNAKHKLQVPSSIHAIHIRNF